MTYKTHDEHLDHHSEDHTSHTGHDHSGSFWENYTEILSDPAHLSVEITLMILLDVIILGILWPLLKKSVARSVNKDHAKMDEAHGIVHHNDHVHVASDDLENCVVEDQQTPPQEHS